MSTSLTEPVDRLAALLREAGVSVVEDLGDVFQAVLES